MEDELEGFLNTEAEAPEAVDTPEAPETPEVAEQVEETPSGPVRDEKGRFAPKGETEEAASPAAVEAPLDHAALIGERRRRQEAEAELERLRQQIVQPQQVPQQQPGAIPQPQAPAGQMQQAPQARGTSLFRMAQGRGNYEQGNEVLFGKVVSPKTRRFLLEFPNGKRAWATREQLKDVGDVESFRGAVVIGEE